MNDHQSEEFAALAQNWREAEEAGDTAASQAFEDELQARVAFAEISQLEALDPKTGEPSSAETDQLRSALREMWNNASARLG